MAASKKRLTGSARKQHPLVHSKSLDRYFEEISQEKPLSPQEEVKLAQRVRQNDQEALHKLLKSNLRFVVTIAKKYQGQGLSLEDLINEGNLGLIKAAKRFDESRGFKFISYAVWWIRQSILQAISEQSRIIRLPLNVVGTLNKVTRLSTELQQNYEREPSSDELRDILNVENIDVDYSLQLNEQYISMDAPLGNDEDNTMKDILESREDVKPDSELMQESLKKEILRVLSTLEAREALIIRLYFGINQDRALTLEEIGDRMNLTRERVRQIKERAIRKLRHTSRAQILRTFLG